MSERSELLPAVAAGLERAGLEVDDVLRVVKTALTEDLRYGPDATTEATVPADATAEADLTPRAQGVLAGGLLVGVVLDLVAPGAVEVVSRLEDGTRLSAGEPALVLRGPVRALLTAERTALNLVCHLSGVATATAAWVDAVAGTHCAIRDTRKTLPGLRLLEKYAVRCGGGVNHRLGLGDAVLIKDNHVVAAGSVSAALAAVRARALELPCEVEVTTLAELDAVLEAKAELVLLDNFSVEECAEAVRRTRAAGTGTLLEASGGLSLDVARAYASTGVDYLAVGALTHSAPALDLGLDLR
ncbi:carboxylating nicotinate-nucleotide diphosphorylase [Actinopolymorpha alba]|uniref:carboxylating nicotinate-nucleotide diphosphorylase n=1 Tax=Actinopolymorpha alba TaxID=533267 RepID=UPI0003801184|nr:carboxylating nicotinate-nucleotide diphosphorylase [Actinopolymorpha alba]